MDELTVVEIRTLRNESQIPGLPIGYAIWHSSSGLFYSPFADQGSLLNSENEAWIILTILEIEIAKDTTWHEDHILSYPRFKKFIIFLNKSFTKRHIPKWTKAKANLEDSPWNTETDRAIEVIRREIQEKKNTYLDYTDMLRHIARKYYPLWKKQGNSLINDPTYFKRRQRDRELESLITRQRA
jgi:hypothetical protein